jgi:predicted O-methyltransferase YrrM
MNCPYTPLFEIIRKFNIMSNQSIGLSNSLYQYLVANSVREPEILTQLRAETAKHPLVNMQISPEQGQLMGLLVQLIGAKKCLEVGVFTGYSSLVVALNLPEDGQIIACDVSDEFTLIARNYWQAAGVSNKINLYIAPALETLDRLLANGEAGTFDFAFIDADKNNYAAYYDRCFQLVRQGGLILVDNVLWYGRVADPTMDKDSRTQAIKDINQQIYHDDRVQISLIPIGDGLTIARKK